jgi:single-stranded DNA-binding protein
MASMITIVGNLGADAERKRVGEHDLAELRVAVTTGWGDRKVTTWWRVQQWGAPAEWIGQLRKGAGLTVVGEAWVEEWTSRDGKTGTTPTIRASSVIPHERAAGDAAPRKHADRGGEAAPSKGDGGEEDMPW